MKIFQFEKKKTPNCSTQISVCPLFYRLSRKKKKQSVLCNIKQSQSNLKKKKSQSMQIKESIACFSNQGLLIQ